MVWIIKIIERKLHSILYPTFWAIKGNRVEGDEASSINSIAKQQPDNNNCGKCGKSEY